MQTTAKSSVNRDERIAALAHSFWEQDGRPDGRADEHWLRAAFEVDAKAPGKAAADKKPAAKKPRKAS